MTLVALRTHRVLVAGLLLVVSLSLAGCGRQPQVKPMNRRLIESLRTALSARNTEWLDANWKLIEKAHTDGSMDDAEFSRFKEIVDIARAGEHRGGAVTGLLTDQLCVGVGQGHLS